MSKIRLMEAVKDDEDIKLSDDVITEEPIENETIDEEPEQTEDIMSDDIDESPDFIVSDELNSIREVLLDIPEDVQLLLLNEDMIVLGEVVEGKTMLYTLSGEDATEFIQIEMPNDIADITSNPNIIKYTPDGPDERHSQVMDILMNSLQDDDTEIEPEQADDVDDEVIEEPTEEVDTDEEDK